MTTSSQQDHKNIDSDEISLREIILKIRDSWRYLSSRWFIILTFGLLGAGLGFAYAYFKKPVYTATTTFVLEDEKSGGGLSNLAGLASMAGVDMGGGGGGIFQGDNILGFYKSRTMLEQTLLTPVEIAGRKQLLIDRYIDFNGLRTGWAEKPSLANLEFTPDSLSSEVVLLKPNRLRDSVIGVIVNDLNKNYLHVARPDIKLGTINVDVKSRDELFAKAFNDELVKNVNEFYVNTKTQKTLQNVKILQHKADSVRAVMNGAIYRAIAVADATPNLNPTRQIQRVAPAQKAQYSAETNKAILAEMLKNLEMSKMALLKETPLIQVIDQPIYPLEVEKFGNIKAIAIGGLLGGAIICIILLLIRMLVNRLQP